MNLDAKELIGRFEKMQGDRGNWENQWQEILELVRPNSKDFNRTGTPGEERTHKMFDSTANEATEQLAAGLTSYLASPSSQWIGMTIHETDLLNGDYEVKKWLYGVSDQIYKTYQLPSLRFNTMLHECFMDTVAFGTGIMSQVFDFSTLRPSFRTYPLADCFMQEDVTGAIDTLFRKESFTTRQCRQRWKDLPKAIADCKDYEKTWNFVHAVFPRRERDVNNRAAKNMPFASVWIFLDKKIIVEESGYIGFPYHVARWSTLAGEVYGRSPAMNCLPDIRMLNEMWKTVLKGAQKIVDPPLMVPDDGFIMPIRTTPSSLLIYESGTQDRVEPLVTGGRPDLGLDLIEAKRQAIMRMFHVDWLNLQKNNKEMTAFEVGDRRDEQFRMIGPQVGRLHNEFLGPLVSRTYTLLDMANMIPDSPRSLKDKKLLIENISPAAKAQNGTKAVNIDRYLQTMLPVANIKPDALDIVDTDAVARIKADVLGVPYEVIRSDIVMQKIRQERQQQQQLQQMQQAADTGKSASEAVRNVQMGQAALLNAERRS